VYGVMDLRTLARNGLLTNDFHTQLLLDLPISASDIVKLVSQNRDALHDKIGQDSTELYLSAFDNLVDPQDSFEVELDPSSGETKILLNSVEIVMVDDENSDTELVYGICVNNAKKQITLIFRGCTTTKDWRISADPFLTKQEIRLNVTDEKAMYISIHRGFYNYLLHPSHSATGTLQKNKFERICDNLQRLLERYPGYRIYCTGHSLGGALATVFAFEFAVSSTTAATTMTPTPSDPVTCITFASPMVGNLSFEQAFRELECQGRLRALRVTNHFDIFTQLPDRASYLYAILCCGGPHVVAYYTAWSCMFFACCQNRIYRHVGMDLHLYKNERYKMKHTTGSSPNFWFRLEGGL
jgi:Lipase (class 3)